MEKQGNSPVIFITFPKIKSTELSLKEIENLFRTSIQDAYLDHMNIYKKKLIDSIKQYYSYKKIQCTEELTNYDIKVLENDIQSNNLPIPDDLEFLLKFRHNDPSAELKNSLKQLIMFLYNCFRKEVIVIIDEYDTPLCNMFWSRHYENIKILHGNILDTLKNNPLVKQSILIGCFPILLNGGASELNHLIEINLFEESFTEYFGFTEEDVDELLEKICHQADINGQEKDKIKDAVKNWYNGYLIDKLLYTILTLIARINS